MSDDLVRHLSNGRAPLNKGGDFTTRRQVEAYVLAFANESILPKMDEMLRHYMMQVPELVAKIVSDMATANGLTFHGPSSPAVLSAPSLAPAAHDVAHDVEQADDLPLAESGPSQDEGPE